MRNKAATALTVLAMLAAMAAPIILAIHLAERHGREFEMGRALEYAKDVLHRSDIIADQADAALGQLAAARAADPCGEENIELMRRLHLAASDIQAFGYVSGDRILCSSLGKLPDPLPIGTVQFETPNGVKLRENVEFAFAPGRTYIVIERDAYVAIIHKDTPIDATTKEVDVSLVAYLPGTHQVHTSRGVVNPMWIDALGSRDQVTFVTSRFVVGAVRSARHYTAAIAALPITHLEAQTRETALVLVPVGVAAGVILALCVLHLVRLQLSLPAVLRSALRRGEFFLEYQPIVDLRDGRWVGAEALIRWHRPDGTVMLPDLFIPAAEESGLIVQVTQRVAHLAGRDARQLFERYPRFHIALNLSQADLHSEGSVKMIQQLAAETGAYPGNLVVEVTERGFTDPELAGKVIGHLRSNGVKIAIDDFGTGYSSLSHLQRLELDLLKIDKSFVDSLGTDAATHQVVFYIIEMAKSLGLEMIAEGVQTPEQADALRERGVQFAQGWLFGRPMRFAELETRLPKATAP